MEDNIYILITYRKILSRHNYRIRNKNEVKHLLVKLVRLMHDAVGKKIEII